MLATTRSVSRVISSTGTVISISCLQPSRSMSLGGSWGLESARSPQSPTPILCPFAPACQVVFLFGREAIDLYAHGFQLHTGHLFVQIFGNGVDALFQAGMVFDHVLGGKRLIGEAHIHHRSRMAFGCGQIDEAAFTEHVDLAAIAHGELFHKLARRAAGGS